MNEKYLKLNRLYKEALPRICGSAHEYNRFLQTAAFNYRMSFNNSVAAFAQNVGTDLLLTYDQWQLYGRVPKRYSKQTRVVKAVQSIYQSDETSLQRILYSETMKRVNDFVTEDFLDVDNPTEFLSKSVVNMLLSRFGMEMPYTVLPQSISAEQLQKAFRTAMDVFRAEYAELAVSIPVELRLIFLIVVGCAVIQLLTAVGAINQSRKHTDDSCPCRFSLVLTQFPYKFKGFSINNSRMGVFKYQPLFGRKLNLLLVLEGLALAAEVDRISAILLFTENIGNSSWAPMIRYAWWFTAVPTNADPVFRRSHHFVCF